ncbi:MAG: hypothetical protein ACFFF4_11770 [Candidatus Thorarchaeota archaeon]
MRDLSISYEGPSGRQSEELRDPSALNLFMRAATSVNLETLRDNYELSLVEISKNQLESIDLEPLRSCSNLRYLRLRSNRLKEVNLWPLVELVSLEEVDLVDNRLKDINITPIIGTAKILLNEGVQVRVDYLLRYLVGGEDSSRIQLCKNGGIVSDSSPRIHWQYYADLTEEYGWDAVHFNTLCILEKLDERCWFRAQKGFLEGMGMPELSGFDGDPSLMLKNIDESSDFHSVRSSVFDSTTELLEEQLENGGSTLFLDVGKISGTRAVGLIPLITELRDKEMESVVIQIGGNQVNLLPLWLTHWGYEILSVLRFGLTTDLEGYDLIQRNLGKLGFEIRTEDVGLQKIDSPKNMSEGLIDYIYTLATMNYTNSWISR